MKITQLSDRAAAHIQLVGELDEEGGKKARRRLVEIVKAGRINLTIDLDGVGALQSGGLAALIATLRSARYSGGDVRVHATQPHIRQILELTGLSRVFKLSGDHSASAQAA